MVTYLGLDIATIAMINITLQTISYFILLMGFRFAKKSNFRKHGIMMSTATLLMFISMLIVMLPSFYSIISRFSLDLNTFMIVLHHTLGAIALIMAIIVNLTLRPCGSIMGNKKLGNVRIFMISLFTLWSITYFLGIIIYLRLYFALF